MIDEFCILMSTIHHAIIAHVGSMRIYFKDRLCTLFAAISLSVLFCQRYHHPPSVPV
jgi:hypothetical protein